VAARRVRVTHPFHPLVGRELEVVDERGAWGDRRVYFYDERGMLGHVPARWTSAVPEDPFVVVSAGRSWSRVEDLLRLLEVVSAGEDDGRGSGDAEKVSAK
jgi:hypothetical protein